MSLLLRVQDLLFEFCLYYDRDRHAPPGWTTPEDKPVPKQQTRTGELSFTEKMNIPYRVDENGTRVLDWSDKSPDLTDRDRDIIKAKKLDEDKYREIKGQWAIQSMTCKKASVVLQSRHGRGYGKRTVETYWSAMNAAFAPLPSPK